MSAQRNAARAAARAAAAARGRATQTGAKNIVFIDRDNGYRNLMDGLKLAALREQSAQAGWWASTDQRAFNLALWHEFGHPDGRYPARPILSNFFDQNRPILARRIAWHVNKVIQRGDFTSTKRGVRASVRRGVEEYGKELKARIEKFVLEEYPGNRLAPNARSTIETKGFDLPMVETGRMLDKLEVRVHKRPRRTKRSK